MLDRMKKLQRNKEGQWVTAVSGSMSFKRTEYSSVIECAHWETYLT